MPSFYQFLRGVFVPQPQEKTVPTTSATERHSLTPRCPLQAKVKSAATIGLSTMCAVGHKNKPASAAVTEDAVHKARTTLSQAASNKPASAAVTKDAVHKARTTLSQAASAVSAVCKPYITTIRVEMRSAGISFICPSLGHVGELSFYVRGTLAISTQAEPSASLPLYMTKPFISSATSVFLPCTINLLSVDLLKLSQFLLTVAVRTGTGVRVPAWSAGEMGLKVHTGIAVSVGGVVSVKLRKLIPYLVRKVERMVVGNVDRSTEIARRLGAYRRRLDATCGLLFTSKNDISHYPKCYLFLTSNNIRRYLKSGLR